MDATNVDALAKLGIGITAVVILGLVVLRLLALLRDFMDSQATIQKGLTEALNRINANGEVRDKQIAMLGDSFAAQNRTGNSMVDQLDGIRNESAKTADRAQLMVEHIKSQTRDLSDALSAHTTTIAKRIEASEQRVGQKVDDVPKALLDPLIEQLDSARVDRERIQEAIKTIPNQFRDAILPIVDKLEAMQLAIEAQHQERKEQLEALRGQLIEAVRSASPVGDTPGLGAPRAEAQT